jgi:hypothetical protein
VKLEVALFASLVAAVCCGATGCQRPTPEGGEGSAWIVLVPDTQSGQPVEPLWVEPKARSISRVGGRIVVEVQPERAVRITPREGCAINVDARSLASGDRVERTVDDWLGFGGPHVAQGYGATVELRAAARCDEAKQGNIDWRQIAGPASRFTAAPGGRSVTLVLPSFAEAHAYFAGSNAEPRGPFLGISPRTQGEVVLEAVWHRPGTAPINRRVRLSAAARLRGLPNVAVNTPVALRGGGYRIDGGDGEPAHALGQGGAPNELPARHGARDLLTEDASGVSWFDTAHAGRFALVDAQGKVANLRAERLDATPLDCGRAGCHEAIAQSAATSPMTTVLARLMGDRDTALQTGADESYPACAIGCHSVGEPGLDDGGFVGALNAHGLRVADLSLAPFEDLPPGVRHLAGVTCLGCHGPAAIPEPEARWTMLQTDVCAACHDAPPRYGHVQAWQGSKMAHGAAKRLENDPMDRSTKDPRCVTCHTTAGFLHRLGDSSVAAPASLGLTCATCHDPHPAPAPAGPGLFRHVEELPRALGDRASAVPDSVRACVACHTPPDAKEGRILGPSQAALTAGRGGVDPSSGEPLEGEGPHWAIAGGCVGCHDQGPADLKRGRDHAFQASPDDCGCCHASKPVDKSLQERARVLLERFGSRGVAWAREAAQRKTEPGHAHVGPEVSLATPLERGAYDALLVFEDAGASAHNDPYAKKLLEAAARALVETKAGAR